MINFDRKFLKGEKIKPCVWLRYIGDIFFMQRGSEEDLDGFLGRTYEFNPNLKLTCEKSYKGFNFLCVIEKIQNNQLVTNLFWNPVDGQQCFHHNFCKRHIEELKQVNILRVL